jgi:glycosyltransferase involved in cell wall biosynthesis
MADINSVHVQKWVTALSANNIEIGIFSLNEDYSFYFHSLKNVRVFCPISFGQEFFSKNTISKLRYLKTIPFLRQVVKEFQPDIIHAHYASSYGFLGSLLNFHPFYVSVWGSDIYDFPKKSRIHTFIIKRVLQKADGIFSTSQIMKQEIGLYTHKPIDVVPFGIDLIRFTADNKELQTDEIYLGTVKSLESKYGIDQLIDAFHLLVKRLPNLPLRLLIVGKGSLESRLKQKVRALHLSDKIIFTGFIPNSEVADFHRLLTLFIASSISKSESFGVSAVEAMACGVPVIANNIGGLAEVVVHGETGLLVSSNDTNQLAAAIEMLLLDPASREQFGQQARAHVARHYNWQHNVDSMINFYHQAINNLSPNKKEEQHL